MSAELALRQLSLFNPERLAQRPYCTNELGGLRVRPVQVALGHRHIQANHPALHWRVVFDIDRPDGANAWRFGAVEVAAPNWTASNPDNGHAHIGYEVLDPIVMTAAASRKPIKFAAAIEDAYGEALKADVAYSGFMCKNPRHPHWEVEVLRETPYDLPELAEWVNLSKYNDRRLRKTSDYYGLGRNCTLFDRARFWAYRHVDEYRSIGQRQPWLGQVELYCLRVNDEFPAPLSYNEVKGIAKSVGNWTWDKYLGNGNSKKRGVLHLDPDMPLAEKQRRAADYVHKQRRAAMEKQIKSAIEKLTAKGERVTQGAVARIVGVSRPTISKHYRHLLDQPPATGQGAMAVTREGTAGTAGVLLS